METQDASKPSATVIVADRVFFIEPRAQQQSRPPVDESQFTGHEVNF